MSACLTSFCLRSRDGGRQWRLHVAQTVAAPRTGSLLCLSDKYLPVSVCLTDIGQLSAFLQRPVAHLFQMA